MKTAVDVGRVVDTIERECAESESADDLLERLSAQMQVFVPHDAAMWFGLDPVTMIATEPSRIENMDASLCDTFWHLEFHEQDTALFSDLARDGGVAALRSALDGRPGRSPRYREFLQPQGYDDELRGVFRSGRSSWGVVGLYREPGRRPFDGVDLEIVRAISEPVAGAFRAHVRATSPWLGQPSAPGLLIVDSDGRMVSANDEARCWLRDLWPAIASPDEAPVAPCDSDCAPGPCGIEVPTDLSVLVGRARAADSGCGREPTPLIALIARARAVAEGRERIPARLRLRDQRGRWVVFHASVLNGAGSGDGLVAVVIEAAKSAEVAPIIIEAYSLTPRERDVLAAIARGGSTNEIAAELFLSPHTVRDHIKTVFEKMGVSSRGELVARLFGEHYTDRLHDTMVHLH